MSFPFWEFMFRGLPLHSFAFLPLPSSPFILIHMKMGDNNDFYCSDTAPEALSDDMERKPKLDLEEHDSEWAHSDITLYLIV